MDDIPRYSLHVILNMSSTYFEAFVDFFEITDTKDVRGQILIELNNVHKVTFPEDCPINHHNLEQAVKASVPMPYESTDPAWGIVDRYQRMLYHLTVSEFQDSRGLNKLQRTISSLYDVSDRIRDRHLYFETGRGGNPLYVGDNDGPYQSSLHTNIEKYIEYDGKLYLIYGTITPNLSKQRDIVKMLNRSIGWMPDVKNKGWSMILSQMVQFLRQDPMPFVGLLHVDDGVITQPNGDTILYGSHLNAEDWLIETDIELLDRISNTGELVEDQFGNATTGEGIWFEIPVLSAVSPRISLAGLRYTEDNEIIGVANFRCLQLPKTDQIKLPKLKTTTLFM